MEKKGLKDAQKELSSIPTSYRILIKGTVANSDSKQLRSNIDENRHIWKLCSFRNPARSDGLVLRHWRHFEKSNEYLSSKRKQKSVNKKFISHNVDDNTTSPLPPIEEEDTILDSYPFARVNPSIKIYRYSDDFYRFHLAELDPTWTKDETDLLFDLCEMFELRFIAIHDCFKWRKDIPLEKLKQRYYSVTKRIVEFLFEEKIKNEIMKHNNPNHPIVLALKDESTRHPLVKYTYNPDNDRDRRQMLERSYRITKEQKDLEAQLLNDIKQAETKLKSEEKKRSEMRKLKRRFHINEADIIPTPKMDQLQSKNVWLASSCIAFYKSQLTQRHNDAVDEMLSELNISPPIVSSQASNELYCIVRGDAAIMINVVNKVESLRKELEYWQQNVPHLSESLGTQMQSLKPKDEQFIERENVEPMQMYPSTPRQLMASKPLPKHKGPVVPNVQGLQGMQSMPGLPIQQGMPQVQNIQQQNVQDDDGSFQQIALQRLMMQNMGQNRPPGLKPMYPIKPGNNGGTSPQAFPQHIYAQYSQQMYQQQRMLQQRLMQQQQQMKQNNFPQSNFQPVQMPQMQHPPMSQMQLPQQSFQQNGFSQMNYQQMQMPMHNPEAYFSPNQRYTQNPHYPSMMQHGQQLQGDSTAKRQTQGGSPRF
ncbi:conserved hypothetical protein [Theileria equi strain WA]|uniref:dAMP1 SANT/Myb-like domain-containing protein n=1 Tax=Theileria equi strain WA TaxID=1537102 RepID=L1LG73_THEEQ|nr:conserved hypothetical protein [Theileria equi strain WA]EKX74254.1 conserved hypothetical protein [Theileria equi strain WA]|eukprot:XP_004833706.1 conserved hypothetical protein [Theileria equi strain WA]